MKLILEPTDEILDVNGVPCRVWQGVTNGGSRAMAFVAALAVQGDGADLAAVDKRLSPLDVTIDIDLKGKPDVH